MRRLVADVGVVVYWWRVGYGYAISEVVDNGVETNRLSYCVIVSSMARNENNLLSVPYINEEEVDHDYLPTLPLGYWFCPTASDIIVYFLMPKIKTGTNHPKWRLYEETDDSKQQVLLSARHQHLDELSRRKRILMHHQGSSYQTSASTLFFQQQVHSTYQNNQSDESNEDNLNNNYEEVLELDYANSLNPGYHFSPTDSEIIVYYLQQKIETREQHPECRYYIADFYGNTPDNLAGKRSLAYYDNYSHKTPWLMHEYISNNPNILIGSRADQMMKVENMMNSEELMEDQKQLQDEPSARQRRISMNKESNQKNGTRYIQIQDGNHYSGVDLPMVATVRFMCDSDQQLAFRSMDTLSGSSLIYPTFQDPPQDLNSMASTDSFHQAYSSYQDFKHPQATLQSFLDEPMEWTEDDISKEIVENLHEENMSPRSSMDTVVVLTAERDGGSWQPKVAVIVGEEGK
nr:NAC domain-containing protein [Tanacetum cinerariifolium]